MIVFPFFVLTLSCFGHNHATKRLINCSSSSRDFGSAFIVFVLAARLPLWTEEKGNSEKGEKKKLGESANLTEFHCANQTNQAYWLLWSTRPAVYPKFSQTWQSLSLSLSLQLLSSVFSTALYILCSCFYWLRAYRANHSCHRAKVGVHVGEVISQSQDS